MGKIKFYAVSTGRRTGIYTSWNEAEKQVTGYRHCSYKSYTTLQEALQDMRVNGHDDPPIFRHRDVHVTSSDSNLTTNVTYVDTLPPDSPTHQMVMELEHPEICLDHLNVNRSFSCPDVNTNSVTSCSNTMLKEMNNIDSVIQSHNVSSESEVELTLKIDTSENHNTNSTNSITSSGKTMMNDNTKVMFDLIMLMNDKIENLEKKLDVQIEMNQKLVDTIQTNTVNQQKHDEGIYDSLFTEQKKVDKLINEVQSLSNKCDSISESQSKLQRDNDSMIFTQKSLNQSHNNLNDKLLQTQDTLNSFDTKFSEVLDKVRQLNDHQNHLIQEHQTKSGQHTNVASSIGLNNPNDHIVHDQQEIEINKQVPQKTNSLNESFTPSSTKDDGEDENNDLSDIIILDHPMIKKLESTRNNNHKKVPYLHLPDTCRNVILGDSNMRSVNKTRLDRTKVSDIRTYRGASVKTLTEIIASTESVFPNVERVSLCIGSIDCARRYLDCQHLIRDYENLIFEVKQVFPTAQIAIIAIPPQSQSDTNKMIMQVNQALKHLAKKLNVVFGQCDSLWMHVTKDGHVDNIILVDNIHLSPFGLGLLLRSVTSFLFGLKRLHSIEQPMSPGMSLLRRENSSSSLNKDQYGKMKQCQSDQTQLQSKNQINPHDINSNQSQMELNELNSSELSSNANHTDIKLNDDYTFHMKSFSEQLTKTLSEGFMSLVNLTLSSKSSHSSYSTFQSH